MPLKRGEEVARFHLLALMVRSEGRLQNAADRTAQKLAAVVIVVVAAFELGPYGPLGAAASKATAGAHCH